jgi:hypothetical protein
MDRKIATMESFITSYGLPFDEFQSLMIETHSTVAGSAALALYLKQEGVDPGFEPNDMDIWVQETHDTWYANGRVDKLANSTKFTIFLIKHGYNLTTKFDTTITDDYYAKLSNVKYIFSFVNANQKEIQVILLRIPDPIQYIQEHFDLSACITWWSPPQNKFYSAYPEPTLRKEVYILPSFANEERTLKRVEKYKSRGFAVQEQPCKAKSVRDPLEKMENIEDLTAFDVFAYDDVKIGEFLRQSSFHVLLHIGEQFYAYHRNQLQKYLEEHVCEHPEYGTLCELPHKQLIPYAIMQVLPYSDFSIIKLKQVIDLLYYPEYYTTAQWEAKTPAQINVETRLVSSPPNRFIMPSVPSFLNTLGIRPHQRSVARWLEQRLVQEPLSGLTEALYRDGTNPFTGFNAF